LDVFDEMKNLWLLFFGTITLASAENTAKATVDLFNGRDFSGWHVIVRGKGRVEQQDFFKVQEGAIHAYPDAKDKSEQSFAGLVTNESYGDYILSLDYKWGERKFAPRDQAVRDAGVLFHVHGPDEIWPDSIECQIQEGDTGDLWMVGAQASSTVQPVIQNYAPAPGGKIVTRGGRDPRFARFHRGYCWEAPGWNRVEITVRGDTAIFKVNGHVVNEALAMKQWDEATKTWIPLTRGKILLQAEGAEIFYRDVKLTRLAGGGEK
jgi:hypothetical protein